MQDPASKPAPEPVVDRATAEDVPAIERMIEAAYSKYIERIGGPPGPMMADHRGLVETGEVFVLRAGGQTLGSVLLSREADSIEVNNLVVDPQAQGRGYGRLLMEHAEAMARAQGLDAVTLYTNEAMHENVALYGRAGFTETGRRVEDGFRRVFFRKTLS